MQRSHFACLLVALLPTALLQQPRPAPVELKLSPWVDQLRTLTVTAGGVEAPFLFDTGGGATILAPATAERCKCAPFGRGTGFRHDGERVDGRRAGPVDLGFGPHAWHGEVGVLDLDAMFAGLPKIAGIAALDVFAAQPFTLDLAHDRLILETDASLAERARRGTALEVRIAHQAAGRSLDLFVAIEGRHGRQWFELDSGNTAPVLIAPHAYAELGLDPPDRDKVREIELPVVGLGPVRCACGPKEMIYDGVLNAAFCRRFELTFDLRQARVWARAL